MTVSHSALTLPAIRQTARLLDGKIRRTQTLEWQPDEVENIFGAGTRVFAKLEALQVTGSFKVRGTLNLMAGLSAAQNARGVTAVSAGNHAIAVAYAARELGISAKIVMPASASRYRADKAVSYGAEMVFVDDVSQAFAACEAIRDQEGRVFVHPFNDMAMMQGSATCGLEFGEDVADLAGGIDIVLVPVGGGGLAAGYSSAVKALYPRAEVYGVEPEKAQAMKLAFAAGGVTAVPLPTSIADSLGAPLTAEPSFSVCRENMEDIILVTDDDLRRAMVHIVETFKIAVEPAGAATMAALLGPLRERVRGKRVGIILCGANVSAQEFCEHISAICT